ncbi:uncharacterized protein LOC116415884 [Nasonia vitripennis]|uniref:DNA-directed DNA polymerase n=1 Tax=Nasonia vitripennis TaxID=7425 RepID=A0A7M7PVW0_NASVI|nr:uncharacterized protein LOC116415884 [Nasonia vitripennis]
MEDIINEYLQQVKLLEEVERLLFSATSTVDLSTVIRWNHQFLLTLKTFRKVLSNKKLTVQERQSIICTIGKIECMRARLEIMTRRKSGAEVQVNKQNTVTDRVRWIDMDNAFENRMRTAVIANLTHIDIINFLRDSAILFSRRIKSMMYSNDKTFKINTVLSCKFTKTCVENNENVKEKEGEYIETKYFNTKNHEILSTTLLNNWFKSNVIEPLLTDIEEFQERDSGWTLHSIENIQININKFNPMRAGSSYIPLPAFIEKRKACINVKNYDNKCFIWAILSALYPVKHGNHSNILNSYIQYENILNMKGIELPVSLKSIPKVEKQNNAISINMFGLDNKDITPLYLTSCKKSNHINLLLLTNDNLDGGDVDESDEFLSQSHYVYIKSLSRLISNNLTNRKKKLYVCNRCLNFFYKEDDLIKHEEHCKILNKCRITLPNEENSLIMFKNHRYNEKLPFIIYADCECLLKPISQDEKTNTQPIQSHEIYSIGYYLKCSYNDSLSKYAFYRGPEASKWFAEQLRNIEKQISDLYANPLPMPVLSQTELIGYYDSKTCHICKKLLNDDAKVRDHCHLTGKYRGPAHATCNLNYQDSKIVPVVFHNLCGYDAHFIITDVSNNFPGQIDLLPLTTEKYISFTKHVENSKIKVRFLYSFRFMPTSLEKLASYLQDDSIVNKEFSDLSTTQINLLTRKGVLPYKYISSWEKLEECKLPEKEDFFSILNDSSISDRDYEHAQNVWSTFNIQTLGEYSDLYMKTDVLLLADVFENFRDQSMNVYNLDPAHYYTTPGFSWDAMLKHTGVQLKLLTDIDMVLFIERGIRGGLSQCSNRYAVANHKYMLEKYDKDKANEYLIYLDANNLYGFGLSQCLPYDEFQWLENCESFELFSIASGASHGYILEVDLDYPPEIHDDHNDLPFCPEHAKPPGPKQEKLLATLQPKFIILLCNKLFQTVFDSLKYIKF